MEYRLSTTFAELGYSEDLTGRLLSALPKEMPEAGPVLSQDFKTGELTITVAFDSTQPTQTALQMADRMDRSLTRVRAPRERTVLDAHLEAVLDDEGIADAAMTATLQPA